MAAKDALCAVSRLDKICPQGSPVCERGNVMCDLWAISNSTKRLIAVGLSGGLRLDLQDPL